MNRYLLDTHVWVWFQRSDTEKISDLVRDEMLDWQRKGLLLLSPISAWEVSLLAEARLLELGMSAERFLDVATENGGFSMAALSPKILIESTRLPSYANRDPADRILAATARELGVTLVTRDKSLLAYAKQGHLNARKL